MHFQTAYMTTLALLSSALAVSLRARGDAWTIRNFSRNCTDPDICTYPFVIDTGAGTQQCTVVDTGNPATTAPFYNVPCKEDADYHISWGWDYNNDFTVMTVVYEPAQTEAFFGYNSPNAGLPVATYADNGPNAVKST